MKSKSRGNTRLSIYLFSDENILYNGDKEDVVSMVVSSLSGCSFGGFLPQYVGLVFNI
jgi:hypothetical protein